MIQKEVNVVINDIPKYDLRVEQGDDGGGGSSIVNFKTERRERVWKI